MYLTKDEEKIFNGERGEVYQKAIKVIVKVGEALGAERLIDISSAHASGLSYNNIGDPGLEFLEDLARKGAKAAVQATLNPIGYDTTKQVIPLPQGFAEKQLRIINAFRSMGFSITLSCTPYYFKMPNFGEHLAWGESSAVIYANTAIGARTNREGGPLSVLAALIGKTYYAGLHVDEQRKPSIVVDVKLDGVTDSTAGWLGLKIGETVKEGIPYIRVKNLSDSALRIMLAAMAASGSIGMAFVEGITKEHADISGLERIEINADDFPGALSAATGEGSDLYFIGCPHASIEDMRDLLSYFDKYGHVARGKRFWITTGSNVYKEAAEKGIADQLLGHGAEIIVDTCPVVAPLGGMFKRIATNSGKSFFYLSKVHGSTVRIMSSEMLVKEASEEAVT
ncbi:MAG: aconitase X catalytic domain-containing protein [Candidatus Micrarchaeaceae archaeon]